MFTGLGEDFTQIIGLFPALADFEGYRHTSYDPAGRLHAFEVEFKYSECNLTVNLTEYNLAFMFTTGIFYWQCSIVP